jgi:hypothetical protein
MTDSALRIHYNKLYLNYIFFSLIGGKQTVLYLPFLAPVFSFRNKSENISEIIYKDLYQQLSGDSKL